MFLYEGHVKDEWICNELRTVKKSSTYCSAAGMNAGLDALAQKCPAVSRALQLRRRRLQNEAKHVFLIEKRRRRDKERSTDRREISAMGEPQL